MKVMMNKALRLGFIGAVAALLLGVVNFFTEPAISVYKEKVLQDALSHLAAGGTPGEGEEVEVDGIRKRWPIKAANDQTRKGWIVEIIGTGYGGPLTVVASYDTDGTIMVARLMNNSETVGFGKKAESEKYMEIFTGSGGDSPVPRTKNELKEGVDMVSGATVTFSGITEALARGSASVKEWERR